MEDKKRDSEPHTKEKRLALPTRGYYAELLTDLKFTNRNKYDLHGAFKKTKLIWQMKTEKHSPIIRQITAPCRRAFLAPAERWMTFEEDKRISFPVDTFKPKVQLQHEVIPKTLPRNVAIERRRREYQSQNLTDLLANAGISTKDLIPIDVQREQESSEKPGSASWMSFLPLELFDDEEFDIRTPENWLEHGVIENVRHPLPGSAFVPVYVGITSSHSLLLEESYSWINVAVTEYDQDTKLWTVLTLDGLQRTLQLPRLFVRFAAEDPVNFAGRLRAALDLRSETENVIRIEAGILEEMAFNIKPF